ncbi:HIRAN domain-containing protein [Actinokineospora sp. NPDC004072]
MDGNGVRVEFDGAALVVTATNAVAEALFGERTVIQRADIAEVAVTDAQPLRSGALELVLRDGARHRLRFSQAQQPAFADLAARLRPGAVVLHGRGAFEQAVAGESHYFDTLRALTGSGTSERVTVAELRREPDNPYDANAVQVLIDGRVVGYLPRAAAAAYQPALRQVAVALCRARLWWSYEHRELDFIASVSLDLADPAEVLPLNEPEPGPRVELPPGRTYPVRAQYLEALAECLAKAYCPGRGLVYGSLHAEGAAVAVRVDGRRVGELATGPSAAFAPLLRRFAAAGLTCYADVALSGGAHAVQARLRAAAPEDLPADLIP